MEYFNGLIQQMEKAKIYVDDDISIITKNSYPAVVVVNSTDGSQQIYRQNEGLTELVKIADDTEISDDGDAEVQS